MDLDARLEEAVQYLNANRPYAPDEPARWRGLAEDLIGGAASESADPLTAKIVWHGAERVFGTARDANDTALLIEAQFLFESAARLATRISVNSLDSDVVGLINELTFRLAQLQLPDSDAIIALRQLGYGLWRAEPHNPRARQLLKLYAGDLFHEGFAAEASAVYREVEADMRPLLSECVDPAIAEDIVHTFYRASLPIVLAGDPLRANSVLIDAAGLLDRLDPAAASVWRARLGVAFADVAIAIARMHGASFTDADRSDVAFHDHPEAAYPLLLEPAAVGLEATADRRWLNEQSHEWLRQARHYLSAVGVGVDDDGEQVTVLGLECSARAAEIALEMGNQELALENIGFAINPGSEAASYIVEWVPEVVAVTATALVQANRLEDARRTIDSYLPAIEPLHLLPHYGPLRAYLLLLRCASEVRLAARDNTPLTMAERDSLAHLLEEAVAIDDEFMATNARPLSDRMRFLCLAPALRRLPAYLGLFAALNDTRRSVVHLGYETLLRRKYRVTNETVAAYHVDTSNAEACDLLDRVRQIRRAIAAHDAEAGETFHDFRQQRRSLNKLLDVDESYLSWHSKPSVCSTASSLDVCRALPAGTCLLDYAAVTPPGSDPRYGLFLVDGNVSFFDLGDSREIDDAIGALLGEIAKKDMTGENLTAISDAANRVSLLVLGPVLKQIQKVSRIIISPYGPWLGKLPFALLPIYADEQLVDNHVLSFVPSALSLLSPVTDGELHPSAPFVLGDPDFSIHLPEDAFNQFEQSPLAHARQEAIEIAEMLGVEPLIGASATKNAVEKVRAPKVLHLATHGFEPSPTAHPHDQRTTTYSFVRNLNGIIVRDAEPGVDIFAIGKPTNAPDAISDARADWLKRGAAPDTQAHLALILAGFYAWACGAETPSEFGNGLLTAYEFAALDLPGTLVVLSACGSGLGEMIRTESGMAGYRRNASIAGAPTVVTSLWKVPDRPTSELMINMYKHLTGGEDCANALRLACLDTRANYPHPRNWAAFICEGHPFALQISKTAH